MTEKHTAICERQPRRNLPTNCCVLAAIGTRAGTTQPALKTFPWGVIFKWRTRCIRARCVVCACVGLAGATMFGGAAMAADIGRPVYKAPPAGALPVAYDWTGFYVGGHVGYGWAEKDWTRCVRARTSRTRPTDSSAAARSASTIRSASSCSASKATSRGAASRAAPTRLRSSRAPLARHFNTDVDWTSTLTGRARSRVRPLAGLRQGRRRLGERQVQHQPLHASRHCRDDRYPHRLDRRRRRRIRLRAAMVGEARVQLHGLRHARRVRSRPDTSTDIDQQIHAVKFGVNYKFGGGPIMAR